MIFFYRTIWLTKRTISRMLRIQAQPWCRYLTSTLSWYVIILLVLCENSGCSARYMGCVMIFMRRNESLNSTVLPGSWNVANRPLGSRHSLGVASPRTKNKRYLCQIKFVNRVVSYICELVFSLFKVHQAELSNNLTLLVSFHVIGSSPQLLDKDFRNWEQLLDFETK